MDSMIFINARIHPQNTPEVFSVMAVCGKKIAYIGNDVAEAKNAVEPEAPVSDVHGHVIIPAFADSHTHPSCIALTNWRVPLKGNTLEELLEDAAAYCREHSPEEVPYFFGESFQLTMFDENGPRKELLDRYISDRPARLQDFTDHSCWYNSLALELMGIRAGRPDPEIVQGTVADIRRDPDGSPTGWVLEVPDDSLDRILYDRIGWHPDLVPTRENMAPFLTFMTRNGITAVMDAIAEEESIALFHRMDKDGTIAFYYDACILLPEFSALEETISRANRLKSQYESEHVRIHAVKFFMDGTNELGDCGSLEPLRTDPTMTDYGNMNMTAEQLTETMIRLNEAGFDLHLHVVGDRSFRTICDALEKARAVCGDCWRIEVTAAHCELVHPEDMLRPAKLGLRINWSCHWAGGYFGEKSRDYLGRERFDSMYDFTRMLSSGAQVSFSSDVFSYKEAHRAAPFFGIQVSATRRDPEFPLPTERFPGQVRTPASAKLNVHDLIRGYTKTAADQLRLGDRCGTLEPGKDASFLILSEDPYTADPDRLSGIHPLSTYFEGKILYTEES